MASLGDESAQVRRSLSVEPLLGELDKLMRDSLHPAPNRYARLQRMRGEEYVTTLSPSGLPSRVKPPAKEKG